MYLRRLTFLACCAVIGLYVYHQPENAAHTANAILGGLTAPANALGKFASAF